MKSPKSESLIQRDICHYLRKQGLLFWRFSPDTYVQSIGHYVKHEYIPSGLPDVMVLVKGKMIGLEVKKEKGKVSPDQLLMKKRFELLGHEYHVVRSVSDVEQVFPT